MLYINKEKTTNAYNQIRYGFMELVFGINE